jgi:AcrR family transcriptional regulator
MNGRKNKQSDTKNRIMDTAERLFALKGFQGTSIKRLAREARVNQAAVNYHFGSKKALLEKVIERRLGPVNQQRIQQLEAIRKTAIMQDKRPLVRDVLRAFIEPSFMAETSLEVKRRFLALEGWAFSEPNAMVRDIFIHHFEAPFSFLYRAMQLALPDIPEAMLVRRLHFTIGAVAHWVRLSSINLPPSELLPSVDDLKTITNLLLDFTVSGLKAPCR